VEYYDGGFSRHRLSMRQVYRAGEKGFVTIGKRPCITDATTGEKIPVELFVAVLGASASTIGGDADTEEPGLHRQHGASHGVLGGVPMLLVPDQLRSGVSKPHRYEPEIQRTYEEMGEPLRRGCMPARPRSPRDKAQVEVAVQSRPSAGILARCATKLFSLAELTNGSRELLEDPEQSGDAPVRHKRDSSSMSETGGAFGRCPRKRFVLGD